MGQVKTLQYILRFGRPCIVVYLKLCIAKQAKQIFHYKKIKIKLYKNNPAIWFNKTCRIKQLTPKMRIPEAAYMYN